MMHLTENPDSWDSMLRLSGAMSIHPQILHKRVGTMSREDFWQFVDVLQREKGFSPYMLLNGEDRIVLIAKDGVCDIGVSVPERVYVEGDSMLMLGQAKEDLPPLPFTVDIDLMSHAANIEWFEAEIGTKIQKIKDDVAQHREYVYIVSSGSMGQLTTKQLGNLGLDLEPKNYEQTVVGQFDNCIRQMNSDQPSGRLHLLEGPPGTGKSFFIRGLVQECPTRKFLLMFGDMLSGISYPGLVDLLMENYDRGVRLALVVEDADRFISPRLADNVNHVSTLLNATDGLLGEALDLHVVVSTNQKRTDIDEALQRPGRLCEHVRFNQLPPEFATNRCNELHAEQGGTEKLAAFTSRASIAEVYDRARTNSAPSGEPRRTIGFRPERKQQIEFAQALEVAAGASQLKPLPSE